MSEKRSLPDTREIPNRFRPVPFWSWNERLDEKETARQVKLMQEAGLGGFFMHARGGLQTEYMGEDWFRNVTAARDEAKRLGMYAWAYDENGWPSGFGAGAVNGKGEKYIQKYLRMSDTPVGGDRFIAESGEHWFYYDVNPFYVDNLDKDVVAEFIRTAYEPYFERYGNTLAGFFTDEPQLSRDGIPWSLVLEDAYRERYGDDIAEHLEDLFLEKDGCRTTRIRFWKLVTDLFSEAYFKQISDWCRGHGLLFTGHLVLEESLYAQLATNGACMAHYEFFDMPGMDWLGRGIFNSPTQKQVSSVAEQMGTHDVLSEDFALCGHSVSFAELKGIFEWQAVRGINRLCPHLEGYSLRGIRKRDYPPAMYVQQPWWSEYRAFTDAISRECMLLSEGIKKANVLLIHPMTEAWALFDGTENSELYELNQKMLKTLKTLDGKHITYHFGDETVMERHARVEGDRIVIGDQTYDTVILLGGELLDGTRRLLDEYRKNGGRFSDAEALSDNTVVDREDITYTSRDFADGTLHFFVNTSPDRKTARFTVKGRKLDIYTGEWEDFDGVHEFEPWGSLAVFSDGNDTPTAEVGELPEIHLDTPLTVGDGALNALTLDRCDYWFDGELQERNGYVLNICERANRRQGAVHIREEFRVTVGHIPSKLSLVTETPELFDIKVNGVPVGKPNGYFRDIAFRCIDIAELVKQGENVISFETDFVQSPEFYESLKASYIFESERNRLAYDREIEAIYLVGDFSVGCDGKWETLGDGVTRFTGSFSLEAPKKTVSPAELEKQGYPFFCGELTLHGKLTLNGKSRLVLDTRGVNAVRVRVGDTEKTLLTDDRLTVSGSGETDITVTLINNLRNLLGPHHLPEGESRLVCPSSFYKEPCVWNGDRAASFDEGYCLTEFGIGTRREFEHA